VPRPKPYRPQIGARLTPDLQAAVDQLSAERGLSPSEILREALHAYVYGSRKSMGGPDEGYAQARRDATRIARAVLEDALAEVPEDRDEAVEWLAARGR
jgi:predicted transcriptional regulator